MPCIFSRKPVAFVVDEILPRFHSSENTLRCTSINGFRLIVLNHIPGKQNVIVSAIIIAIFTIFTIYAFELVQQGLCLAPLPQ